jgi:hypothetical protein
MSEPLRALIAAPGSWFARLSSAAQDRLVGLALFLPTGTVLGIALSLTPDPAGMGTHRQLGLGGCAILTMTGFPCPMCGMTTTFTHLAHLHLIEGTINQPFGLFLFLATVLGAVVGFLDLVKPASRWRRVLGWVDRRETALAVFLLSGMGLGWIYKVVMVKGFPFW